MIDFTVYTHLKICTERRGLVVLRRTARIRDDELAYMICPRLIVRRCYVYFFPLTDRSIIVRSTYYHHHYYDCCDVPIVTYYILVQVSTQCFHVVSMSVIRMCGRDVLRGHRSHQYTYTYTGIHNNNIILPIYHVPWPSSNRVSVIQPCCRKRPAHAENIFYITSNSTYNVTLQNKISLLKLKSV